MLFEGFIHDLVQVLPWVAIKNKQSAIRAIIEQRRRIYDKEKVASDSLAIVEQIEKTAAFREAKTVMLYYPIHNEVDLRELVKRHVGEKTFLLPVTHRRYMEPRRYEGEDKMHRGRHKIMEPITEKWKGTIDLILVPGVVFDTHRERIGRGGGYYDKFLRKHRKALKVGVCYDFQLKKKLLPQQLWDIKMDRIITPTQTIE